MRWPIQVQVLLSIVVVAAVALALSVAASSYFGSRQARRQQENDLRRVIGTLTEAHFPLTERVLEQMSGLSGAEFARLDAAGRLEAATVPLSAGEREAIAGIPADAEFRHFAASPVVEVGGHAYLGHRVPLATRPFSSSPGSLAVLYRKDRLRETAARAAYPALFAGAVTAVVAVLVASALAQRFVRPLKLLGEQTAAVAGNHYPRVTVPRRNDEIRDLAERINTMTEKLARYEAEVRRSERLSTLGQLGAGMAHQLRNSATGARMDIELHRRECPVGGASGPPLEVALRELQLMESYLQRFLSLGRARPQAHERVDLDELVADALEMVRPACAHNKVELQFHRVDARLVVSGEAQGLRELLINLSLNAVEAATRHPGNQPRVAVELVGGDGHRAIVRVKDSGPGPSPETAETLFEPFVSEKPEGTGLGLFVARQIAEAHGGSLGWTRTDGMTCFEIELPLIDDDTDHGTSTGS